MKVKSFLEYKEVPKKYQFGCLMLFFKFPLLNEIQRFIEEDDIYIDPEDDTYGLTTEPHVTLLYGIHSDEVSDEEVMDIDNERIMEPIVFTEFGVFENELYDVLKLTVVSEELTAINAELREKLPYTNSYNDYKPHCTIVYLKPGTAKKYIDILTKEFINEEDPLTVVSNRLIYSKQGTGDKVVRLIRPKAKKVII